MTDITVVILTFNEHLHLQRCFDRLSALGALQVVVVDSGSTDDTREIAKRNGAILVEHVWPGTQAEQYNWFIDSSSDSKELKKTSWVLRLDADEYLTRELIEEIKIRLPAMPENVAGVILKRRHVFSGTWMKYGTYPVKILRLYRTGRGRYDDNMLMDEHLHV
ncbi:MAG: glycosyltransferase, partial [Kiritimatiellae bacterium]|nr:glycosyltransferase [Kiritimatiellia bacterium]